MLDLADRLFLFAVKRYLFLLLVVLLPIVTHADTFRLRNGTTITGTFKSGEGGQVLLQTAYGVITYRIADFDDATQARLEQYKITPPATPIPRATPAAAAARPAVAVEQASPDKRQSAGIRKLPQTPAEWQAFIKQLKGRRMAAFYGGIGLLLVAGLWFLVRAFKQSVWWGLGCLLCYPLNLIFLFAHWKKARDPFLLHLVGFALCAAAIYWMNG